jgi:transcriptional regulator with XRE-family HTH domain
MARTPKAQALGRALRQAREAAGLTVREVGALVGVNHGTISRWETGERPPRPDQVARLLTLLQLTGERYEQIMTMAHGIDHAMWVATTLPEQAQQLRALGEFEQDSTRIVEFNPLMVPGLFQIDAYIEGILSDADLSSDDIRRRKKERGDRRCVLAMARDAPQVLALIGMAALQQIIGDRRVMAAQLRHLIELAARPNVEVRIVPFGKGWHPGLVGAFHLLDTRSLGPIVQLENLVCSQFLHERADVHAYEGAVGMLLEAALNADESVRFMANVANRMEQSP